MNINSPVCIMVRVFTNSPRDQSSIPSRVIPKTQKLYWIPPCLTLSIMRYGSRVKGSKVASSTTPRCCSNWRFRVILDYGSQFHSFMNIKYFNIMQVIFKHIYLIPLWKGTSGGVMVSKLDSQTYTSEFESHWVPHSFGLVLNRSKDLRKLLLTFWPSQLSL